MLYTMFQGKLDMSKDFQGPKKTLSHNNFKKKNRNIQDYKKHKRVDPNTNSNKVI